jgi:hypothetical protein
VGCFVHPVIIGYIHSFNSDFLIYCSNQYYCTSMEGRKKTTTPSSQDIQSTIRNPCLHNMKELITVLQRLLNKLNLKWLLMIQGRLEWIQLAQGMVQAQRL